MLKLEDAYFLGNIIKKQGLNGAFFVSLDTTHPEEYLGLDSVFVSLDGNLIPFFIDKVELISAKKARFTFTEVTDPHQIEMLQSKEMYLPLSSLPKLSGKEFYFFEVEGFKVYEEEGQEIGEVIKVVDNPAQPIIEIRHSSGKEILLPKTDETIKKINREEKSLTVSFPIGLLDIYL